MNAATRLVERFSVRQHRISLSSARRLALLAAISICSSGKGNQMPSCYAAQIFCLLATLLILPAPGANAGLFGPSTYEECITESMKGVSSNVAAQAIIKACRNRFPEKKPPAPPEPKILVLPLNALGRIDGRLQSNTYSGGFWVDLYNGAQGWHVTEIIIRIEQLKADKSVATSHDYRLETNLAPLSTGLLEFRPLVWDKTSQWSIIAARGRRTQ